MGGVGRAWHIARMTDYDRIAEVIRYIDGHREGQPDLETLAGIVGLDPPHFHRLFSACAGITPKGFLQCLAVQHARRMAGTGHGRHFRAHDREYRNTRIRIVRLLSVHFRAHDREYRNTGARHCPRACLSAVLGVRVHTWVRPCGILL